MPITWHSLFETVEGLAALATVCLAIGTIILAVATLRTARRTREVGTETKALAQQTARLAELTEQEVVAVADQARAAREEVEVSRRALQASVRPCVVDVPSSPYVNVDTRNEGETRFILAIRNVGTGLAMLQGVRMYWQESGAPNNLAVSMGTAEIRVLPPTEAGSLVFWFGSSESARIQHLHEIGRFYVEVDYFDVAGEQAETTRVYCTLEGRVRWMVVRVALLHEGDTEPYVSSGQAY